MFTVFMVVSLHLLSRDSYHSGQHKLSSVVVFCLACSTFPKVARASGGVDMTSMSAEQAKHFVESYPGHLRICLAENTVVNRLRD